MEPLPNGRRASTFIRFTRQFSRWSGHPVAFWLAAGSVIAWAAMGPLFNYSPTWQLVINTATTIVTFLMVFLIQSAQHRDTEAVQLKLDELIKSTRARNVLLDIEDLDERDLEALRENYRRLAEEARREKQHLAHAVDRAHEAAEVANDAAESTSGRSGGAKAA